MQPPVQSGFQFAPLHVMPDDNPLRLCLLVGASDNLTGGPFILLRELPGSRVYLGAVCDASKQVREWVEIWVQTLELRDLSFSSHQERLTNRVFDQRWRMECDRIKTARSGNPLTTGMETKNPRPLIIRRLTSPPPGFLPVESTNWQLCQDDELLQRQGLPTYSASPFRYLYDPATSGGSAFLATAPDAPTTAQVLGAEELTALPEVRAVFNLHAGLIRVARFDPLQLEAALQILEGRSWDGGGIDGVRVANDVTYAELERWSTDQKGLAFLLHANSSNSERLHETFFLKLALLCDMFKEVRACVKSQQLPLLNLTPASFRVRLQNPGDQFPALWTAKCALIKPSQAHSLQINSTDQKYFVRLGRVEPSPFLPEGMGAHSFGIGSVRLRNLTSDGNGTQLEGTLLAEEYLRLENNDLLWFKLPLFNEQLEFYAHVSVSDPVGPKEVRFRTVSTRLPEPLVEKLKQSVGSAFQKSPYEVWPLLSSPCDLYSLGIMAVRLFLANSSSNLPVVVDEFLSLARRLEKSSSETDDVAAQLRGLTEKEPKLLDAISPHNLREQDLTPPQARSLINMDLWLDAMGLLLRLFPGTSPQSLCQDYGDVSPLALETVFDQPIQELETLLLRLRSILTPSLCANEEIAAVLQKQLLQQSH